MRRLIAFGAFVCVLVSAGNDVAACGEKFFFVGRLVKWQQVMAAPVPGVVLMYTNPASRMAAVLRDSKLDELLKRAGHKVDLIADASALTRALASGRYDMLLVDAADADAGQVAQWRAAAPGLVVVPVLYKPSKAEQQSVDKAYPRVLNAEKHNEALALVNNVMKAKPKARTTTP